MIRIEDSPLRLLCDNWQMIAEECKSVMDKRVLDIYGIRSREDVALLLMQRGSSWISGWDGYRDWHNYGIAINYQYPLGDAGLPKTVALLKQMTEIKFANLSLLKSGALLKTHTHSENSDILTFHLGLDVPSGCFINVGGEFMQEKNGKSIVFDGRKPHYAFNASDKDRLILYIEFAPGLLNNI